MSKVDLSLVLPCYNEAEHFDKSIIHIVNRLNRLNLNYEIIFVEDKSTDSTLQKVKQFVKKKIVNARIITHHHNLGRGMAVTNGIRNAQGAYVGFIDIDCEVSPIYIKDFINELRANTDVVLGWRKYNFNLQGVMRAICSISYSLLVKIILNSKVPDTEAGYKFFKTDKILPILDKVKNTGWFWDTEIIILCELAKYRIISIPVQFNRRKDKTSTVHLFRDSWKYFFELIQFKIQLLKESLSHL